MPTPLTPITPGTSTGITTQSLWTVRASGVVLSGLVRSCDGCAVSSNWFPSAETTVTPFCSANRIARCSAFQIARYTGSFLQLKRNGSAK